MKKTIALASLLAVAAAMPAFANDAMSKADMDAFAKWCFEQSDANHDGSIDAAEWKAEGDNMWKEIDTNSDGKISFEEMQGQHQQKMEEFKMQHKE